MTGQFYLAIDPGREKCGAAVVKVSGEPVELKVTDVADLEQSLKELQEQYAPDAVLLGNGTGCEKIADIIQKAFPNIKIIVVDEKDTTRTGRSLYWRYQPPTGWKRFLPEGLRIPDGPVDAYAALAIFKQWQKENKN